MGTGDPRNHSLRQHPRELTGDPLPSTKRAHGPGCGAARGSRGVEDPYQKQLSLVGWEVGDRRRVLRRGRQRLLPAGGQPPLRHVPAQLRRRGVGGSEGEVPLRPPGESGCVPVLTPAALPSCRYWDDFHACTLTALTDCQEGARDLWEKLRRESKNLDFQGSLFELCGGGSGAAPSLLPPALPLLLAALWAALVTWLPF